jgi:hypothetical protein
MDIFVKDTLTICPFKIIYLTGVAMHDINHTHFQDADTPPANT